MKKNKIQFVGAGPGAPDLITLRGAQKLAEADVVFYAGSLVHPDLLEHAPKAIHHNTASMNLPEVLTQMISYFNQGKKVVRLHTGDTTLYSTINEQISALREKEIPSEVTPGVSSVFAATAALQRELTQPGITQSLLITRRAGRTPVPSGEEIHQLKNNNTSLALFLSAGDLPGLVEDLYKAGREPSTPISIVYRATWPDEKIIEGTLETINEQAKEIGLKRQAMILVGKALKRDGQKSLLYHPKFSHGYRTKKGYWLHRKLAIYSLTEQGRNKAEELFSGFENCTLFCDPKFKTQRTQDFLPGGFQETLSNEWGRHEGHLFIMAAGIVVRHCAPLLKSKTQDPAVVVSDEKGDHFIPLVGGHLAGANQLALEGAQICGGKAILTTATDVNALTAIDEIAREFHWEIANPERIKEFNNALLQEKPLYTNSKIDALDSQIPHLKQGAFQPHQNDEILFSLHPDMSAPLRCIPKPCYAGIGCQRDVSKQDLHNALIKTLRRTGRNEKHLLGISSYDLKKDEQGLLYLAQQLEIPLQFFSKEELNSVKGLKPSKALEKIGVQSVSEASALLQSQGNLLLKKQKFPSITIALATAGNTLK